MKWILLVLLTIVPTVSDACSAPPRDLRWTEALSAAHGAVLVRAKKLQDVDEELAVFLLERVETISDGRGLLRWGKHVIGVEAPYTERNWHDRLTFWAGWPAGGVRHIASCQFFQRLDPSMLHVQLLGVDGAYALEPIAGPDDRWLAMIRSCYSTPAPRQLPTVLLPDALSGISVAEAASCKAGARENATTDDFLACVRRAGRPERIDVLLQLDSGKTISASASGVEPIVDREELLEKLGMAPGLPRVITLRSLLK